MYIDDFLKHLRKIMNIEFGAHLFLYSLITWGKFTVQSQVLPISCKWSFALYRNPDIHFLPTLVEKKRLFNLPATLF